MPDFFQSAPQVSNTYLADPWLRAYIAWKIPAQWRQSVRSELQSLGAKAQGEWLQWARAAEQNPPKHVLFSPWGVRIDELVVSDGWMQLHRAAAEHGLIATGYERKFADWSRVIQFLKLYLYHPSSAFYSCPLAMADGAARVLEVYGKTPLAKQALAHLTSRDPKQFWTSGQWMTEREGGSDVSNTATIARRVGDHFELFGTKWFSSATTSEMALALARIEGAPAGSKGLSLFYLETHDTRGQLNRILIHRLKDKLGTKALPTAELALQGTVAYPIGEPGQGVKTVATMLNITRLYNSVCAIAQMARALQLWKDYSRKREAFGQPLAAQALHHETVVAEEVQFAAHLALTFQVLEWLGRDEVGSATPEERDLLRLLTPITKLLTGKMAIRVASEVVEGFGGAGYVEDTGIPVLLRDAQVFPIWEGATNVLSLDVLRVMQKTQAIETYFKICEQRLQKIQHKELQDNAVIPLRSALTQLGQQIKACQDDAESFPASARSLAMTLGQIFCGVLMCEWANELSATPSLSWLALAAQRYVKQTSLQWNPSGASDRTHTQQLYQCQFIDDKT